jgi:hypothetical protein
MSLIDAAAKRPWSGRTARRITALLLVLQLAGCAADMVTEQVTAMSFFCMVTQPENSALETAALVVWLLLAFSWIVGLVAIKVAGLRPIYWVLLLAVPISLASQQALLDNHLIFCDGP